ncbi:hypothetical protein NQZ68_040645 [Dissostichus eleginoides]|nr:hypothetical protein NQZ68_040645 [Dissostichus eleginoides]
MVYLTLGKHNSTQADREPKKPSKCKFQQLARRTSTPSSLMLERGGLKQQTARRGGLGGEASLAVCGSVSKASVNTQLQNPVL